MLLLAKTTALFRGPILTGKILSCRLRNGSGPARGLVWFTFKTTGTVRLSRIDNKGLPYR